MVVYRCQLAHDATTDVGMTRAAAWAVVGDCRRECDTSDADTLQELTGLKTLFSEIKQRDIKVCT